MTLPLVSIAIPAYRHARYIEACLESICAQTYPELELVLIDDASPDNTFELAQRFLESRAGRFRRIVLERHAGNCGVSATSNDCIAACRGEWVHLLGSDDILYPDKVARIQAAIDEWNCPELALVHADADFIDADGKLHARQPRGTPVPPGPDRQAWQWLFFGRHAIYNPSIALRRDAMQAIGGFDPELALEDIDCWLRLSVNYAIARVPEVLACYRKHPGNTLRKRIRMLGAQFHTYGKFVASYPGLIPDDALRTHYRQNLWRLWRRLRIKRPWLCAELAVAALQSRFRTPDAADYHRYGRLLDRYA